MVFYCCCRCGNRRDDLGVGKGPADCCRSCIDICPLRRGEKEIELLANSETVATVLPGASLGLGMHFAPARKLLDSGCCVAIASDWNPGSAPMGDLLLQTALLGAYEKLTLTECLAGITVRAAKALNLKDRAILKKGFLADFQSYRTDDYRNIFYLQGSLKPNMVWKRGEIRKDKRQKTKDKRQKEKDKRKKTKGKRSGEG